MNLMDLNPWLIVSWVGAVAVTAMIIAFTVRIVRVLAANPLEKIDPKPQLRALEHPSNKRRK